MGGVPCSGSTFLRQQQPHARSGSLCHSAAQPLPTGPTPPSLALTWQLFPLTSQGTKSARQRQSKMPLVGASYSLAVANVLHVNNCLAFMQLLLITKVMSWNAGPQDELLTLWLSASRDKGIQDLV